jgi:hypothetical protein
MPDGVRKPVDVTVTNGVLNIVSRAIFYTIILLFILIAVLPISLEFGPIYRK